MKCWSTQVINKDVTSASVFMEYWAESKLLFYGWYLLLLCGIMNFLYA